MRNPKATALGLSSDSSHTTRTAKADSSDSSDTATSSSSTRAWSSHAGARGLTRARRHVALCAQ